MNEEGIPIKDIANELKISYSACYHWIKGLRKPEKGNLKNFEEFIESKGPLSVSDISKKFPKHDEIFRVSKKRGMKIMRCMLPKKLGEYSIWYYTKGQEKKLDNEIMNLSKRYNELKNEIIEKLLGD